jgi:hypothetical protein
MEWFYARDGRPGDKTWIGQWNHGIGCCPNRRGMEWVYALHSWFDNQLLLRDVDTGPAVEVFLNDEQTDEAAIEAKKEVLVGDAWPPPAEEITFHAQPEGKLGTAEPTAEDSQSFTGTPDGWLTGRETASKVEFVSEPLTRDMLVVGIPKLELAVSQTLPRVHVIANLVQESEGGRRRLGNCAMNPELREGLDTLTPVIPNERMTIFPPCWTAAQELKAGNRLVLQVMTSDDDHAPSFTVDPNVTVFAGAEGTSVTLPVVTDPALLRDGADTTGTGDVGGGAEEQPPTGSADGAERPADRPTATNPRAQQRAYARWLRRSLAGRRLKLGAKRRARLMFASCPNRRDPRFSASVFCRRASKATLTIRTARGRRLLRARRTLRPGRIATVTLRVRRRTKLVARLVLRAQNGQTVVVAWQPRMARGRAG